MADERSDDAGQLVDQLEVERLRRRIAKVEDDRRALRDRLESARAELARARASRLGRVRSVLAVSRRSLRDRLLTPWRLAAALLRRPSSPPDGLPATGVARSVTVAEGARPVHVRIHGDVAEGMWGLSPVSPVVAGDPSTSGQYLLSAGTRFHRQGAGPSIGNVAGRRLLVDCPRIGGVETIWFQWAGGELLRVQRYAAGAAAVDVDPRCEDLELGLWAAPGVVPPARIELAVRDDGPVPIVPNLLLLIGAMKSGTTTLWNYLVQHPQIHGHLVSKEPHFFSSPENHARGHTVYSLDFPVEARNGDGWAFEASTHYTKYPTYDGVPERIRAFPGAVRMIYIMRDPVERLESHIRHSVAMGEAPSIDRVDWRSHHLAVSRYSMQLEQYKGLFSPEELHLLAFDDLVEDPLGTCAGIEEFLGIAPIAYDLVGARNVRQDPSRPARHVLDTDHLEEVGRELAEDRDFLASNRRFVSDR